MERMSGWSASPCETHEPRRLSAMKLLLILPVLSLALTTMCSAEKPSLSVYQIIPGDSENPRGELIMKLNNPPGRTYYVFGMSINCFPHTIEVRRRGRWVVAPGQGSCWTGSESRPLLPDSYVVFDTYLPPSVKNYAKFRINLSLQTTAPDFSNADKAPPEKRYIELVSEPFFTKDLKPVKVPTAPASRNTPKPKRASK
jgi:hypothetical protein